MFRPVLLAAAMAVASPALAFNPATGLKVTVESGQDFTVRYELGARLTDYWCRAGRYVTLDLGLDRRTRVYRLSPEPQKRGEGITFTLDPARSSGGTGLTTFGGPQDGSLSAGAASAQFCNDIEIRRFGFDRD